MSSIMLRLGRPAALALCLVLAANFASASANPLIQAIGRNDVDRVRALLREGVNPNEIDNSKVGGWTPLMEAARAGSLLITQLLLDSHANVNSVNDSGDTALDVAKASRHSKIALILEKVGGVDRTVSASTGLKPPTAFERALLKVLEAADTEFRPILGKRAPLDGFAGGPKYYSRVVLPGLWCRLVEGDNNWYSPTKGRDAQLYFWCELTSGYWSQSLQRSYEALVDKVRVATMLPYENRDGSYLKTETRPGSKVFKEDRSTVFAKRGSFHFGKGVTYVEVSLNGQFGINGGWTVELKVGRNYPN